MEFKIAIYKFDQNSGVSLYRTFEAGQDSLEGICIYESPEILVTGGAGIHCNYTVFDFSGVKLKSIKSDVTNATSLVFDKHSGRAVYMSQSPEVRIFRPTFNVKNEFKDFGKEHSLFGHTLGVCGITFNEEGKRAFTLSKDKTVREWDLSPEGFQGTSIKLLQTYTLAERIFQVESDCVIQWVGFNRETEANYLCISHDSDLLFFKTQGGQINLESRIEGAHLSENIKGMKFIFKPRSDKPGILFTSSEKKLFSWKPKF